MAGFFSPSSYSKAEVSILEINQDLHSQLEGSKQQFRDLKEKFLISEAAAYSLANQLWKYGYGKCTLVESVLGEKLQSEEEELTEKLTLAEKLRESNIQIQHQAQKLSQLRQKLHQGRAMSFLLSQHLKDILIQDNPDNDQAQGLQGHLAEGYRLAECLVGQLSTENHDEEENGKEQELLAPRLRREGQVEEKVNKTLQFSLDEGHKTPSGHQDLSDTHQSLCITSVLLPQDEISPSLDKAQTEDNQKEEKGEDPVAPRLSREQKEEEKRNVEQKDSLDEKYLAPSSCHDVSYSHQPPNHSASLFEQQAVYCTLEVAKNSCKDGEGQEAKAPRKYYALIHNQARELTQLRQQLREGREASLSLSQHLRDLLTQDDPDNHHGQNHREQLAKGHRLVELLACKLSTENSEKEEDDEKEPLSEVNDQDREFDFLIQVQAQELTQLRQKLQEGREASSFLGQHLKDLFTQDGPDSHQGQDSREQLAEGYRLAEHLAHKLSPENLEDEEKEEEEQESSESLAPRKYDFPVQVQAQELTQLPQQLQKGEETYLSQHLKDLFTQDDPDSQQGQHCREQLAEGFRLMEHLVPTLRPENHDDKNDKGQESLDSSLNSNLQEEKLNELLPDSLHEQYFLSSAHADLSDLQELVRSTALPLGEPEVSSALDGATPMKEGYLHGSWGGDLTPHMSEAQVSCVQLESSTQGNNCLGMQLDQQFNYGDSKARLSLFSTICSSAGNTGSGNQKLLFQGLNSDASFGKKNPPTLEGDALECPSENTCEFEVRDLTGAASVLRQKIIRRKLLLSKRRLACRFPGL